MQTPLVLDAAPQRFAQPPLVRLPGAAWESLLRALELEPSVVSLPGTASVIAQGSDGATQVEYAGRTASFTWPQRLAAGAVLRLVRAPLQEANLAPVPTPDHPRLSATAQSLARLLEGAVREPPPALTLPLEHSAGSAAPKAVAAALADAVTGSGMFFESHLADWVQGTRDTASVLAEARAHASPQATATGDTVFRQQLALLASGETAFRFPAWPGQSVTLTVSDESHSCPAGGESLRALSARLEMELPELGSVQAVLNLNVRGIDVALCASAPETGQALEANRASLARAFATAGLRVGRIEVEDGG